MMAGVLLQMAKLAERKNNYQEALELASEAERVAGTEIISVRDRAAKFKEEILTKINSQKLAMVQAKNQGQSADYKQKECQVVVQVRSPIFP